LPDGDRDYHHDCGDLAAMDLSRFLMDLVPIVVFLSISILIGAFARGRWRGWAVLVANVLALFWLQPATTIRHLDFWFPIFSIGLTILVWRLVASGGEKGRREDLIVFVVIAGIIFALGFTRYLGGRAYLTPTRPPAIGEIAIAVLLLASGILLIAKLRQKDLPLASFGVGFILVCFILLKSPPLAEAVSRGLRHLNGQSTDLASSVDLPWLGFSYIAFRLLHILRDHAQGRLPSLSLRDTMNYVLFFPALSAGPIDRVERFRRDFDTPPVLSAQMGVEGGKRIVVGAFKKFVLADSLAYFALTAVNTSQVNSTAWLWVMLYAYAFRLYLDFSGYTDIAIGIGRIMGVTLPENFNRPYLKPNITAFWTSWHITLAQWFRGYFFNPLTRALRSAKVRLSTAVIVFVGQLSTMTLIGLWHGITWNFLLWGLWHGIGLFIHNRWVDWQRSHADRLPQGLVTSRTLQALSVVLTFQFVTLGWIWFLLPDVSQAWQAFLRLFGA
jgi:alginate O-acetyltransferase complex protein AlgI